jgi:hypothetical protein
MGPFRASGEVWLSPDRWRRGSGFELAPSITRRKAAVKHHAGIDVSLELASSCVVDAKGKIVKEATVAE